MYTPYQVSGVHAGIPFTGRAIDGGRYHWQRRRYDSGLILFVRNHEAINRSKVPEGVLKALEPKR